MWVTSGCRELCALLTGFQKVDCNPRIESAAHMQIAAVHLHPEAYSIANGLQTPTFKLKRAEAKNFFQGVITDMYTNLSDD